MGDESAILYPVDPDLSADDRDKRKAAEFFKIAKMARVVRAMRLDRQTQHAYVAVVGLLSKKILLHSDERREQERKMLKDLLWSTRGKLIEYGLWEGAIRVYVPELCIDIESPGQVYLLALGGPPSAAKPYLTDQPKIREMPVPSIEVAMNVLYDIKIREKEEKENAAALRRKEETERYVECKIEVKIWESESRHRVVPLPGGSVYLTMGPNGLEEVGAEIAALKVRVLDFEEQERAKEKKPFKLEIQIKAQGSMAYQRRFDPFMRTDLIQKWGAKVGTTISVGGRIPKTPIVIPKIEITPYVDHQGNAGVEAGVKIFEW